MRRAMGKDGIYKSIARFNYVWHRDYDVGFVSFLSITWLRLEDEDDTRFGRGPVFDSR